MNLTLALGPSTVFVLIALLAFLIFFFAAWAPLERGRRPSLRPLVPLRALQRLIGQSAEAGKSVHYSPGTAELSNQAGAADTLSGLTSLSSVARVAARSKAGLIVTSNDTLNYQVANDIVRLEYQEAGRLEDYNPVNVRFVTQADRMAYMAGVNALLGEGAIGGNVMLGRLEAEYLLVGDQANRQNIPQVVGSSQIEAMPLMIASAGPENTLLGEEMYAAPAYLDHQPVHLASIVAQDSIRVIILLIILVGVLAVTAGLVPNIGDYFLR